MLLASLQPQYIRANAVQDCFWNSVAASKKKKKKNLDKQDNLLYIWNLM